MKGVGLGWAEVTVSRHERSPWCCSLERGSPKTGEGQEESQGQRQVRAMKYVPREERSGRGVPVTPAGGR